MEKKGIPTVVVGSDDFRRMMPIYGKCFPSEREPLVRAATLHTIAFFLKKGLSVVSDDTNYYSSMRHDLVEIARKLGAIYAIIFIETPLNVALKWNKERGSPIPESVIISINERFEKPGSRYKWDKSIASFDLSKTDAEKAAEETLQVILSLKPEEKKIVSLKADIIVANEIDKITRRIVSEAVRRAPLAAKPLSEARRLFIRKALKERLTLNEVETLFRKKVEEVLNALDAEGR